MVQYQLKGLIRQKKIKTEDVGYKNFSQIGESMLCQFIGHGTEHSVSKKQRIYTIENKKNVEHELNLGFGRGASVLLSGIIFNKKRIN